MEADLILVSMLTGGTAGMGAAAAVPTAAEPMGGATDIALPPLGLPEAMKSFNSKFRKQ